MSLNRSTAYYEPAPTPDEDLALMRIIDELYTARPIYGSRKMAERLTEMALRLLARASDGRLDPAGSAVMLGDTMAVTARHVVQDYWDKLDGRPLTSGLTSTFELIAVRGLRDGKGVVVYLVEGFTLSPTSDLAVLFLRPRGPVPSCALPILNLLPPAVGATIVGVGFHSGTPKNPTERSQ